MELVFNLLVNDALIAGGCVVRGFQEREWWRGLEEKVGWRCAWVGT